ncbi:MAG: twin-arginine translocation signal domain-containing protein, partial [Gammaproteobacteria bacterium]|nr:twin-arginine translocation signal domain-containing protein [Gammaproteobacteria bacterium]
MTASKKLNRRDFLGRSLAGAATLSALGAGGLFQSPLASANHDYKALVFLFLSGGN